MLRSVVQSQEESAKWRGGASYELQPPSIFPSSHSIAGGGGRFRVKLAKFIGMREGGGKQAEMGG